MDPSGAAARPVGVRKVYARPRLTDFGALAELTAGGSGHGKETSSAKEKRP